MHRIVKHVNDELVIHDIEVKQLGEDHIFLNWSKCSDTGHLTRSLVGKATQNVSALNAMIENYKQYL